MVVQISGEDVFFLVVEMVGRMIVGGFVNFNPPPSENLDPGLLKGPSLSHSSSADNHFWPVCLRLI